VTGHLFFVISFVVLALIFVHASSRVVFRFGLQSYSSTIILIFVCRARRSHCYMPPVETLLRIAPFQILSELLCSVSVVQLGPVEREEVVPIFDCRCELH